ncbi:MAG TPA: glycosyl transferase [Candidatus Binatia bacterium]
MSEAEPSKIESEVEPSKVQSEVEPSRMENEAGPSGTEREVESSKMAREADDGPETTGSPQPTDETGTPGVWVDAKAPDFARLHDAAPHVRVLSNGSFWSIVSSAGSGTSQCGWFAVTRWAADRICDEEGVLVYLRDLDSGETWSLGATPMGTAGGSMQARTSPGSVTLGRRHAGIDASCEIFVAADADAEVRRIVLRTRAAASRRIEVTVCAEIVDGHRGGDDGHPAFSKLFVETGFDPASGVVTARRRPRSADEKPLWAAATLAGEGELQLETDRCRFFGRARARRCPAGLADSSPLSGSTGSVLDPVFALRRTVTVAPGADAAVTWILAAGSDRDPVVGAVTKLSAEAATGVKEAAKAAAALEKARRKRCAISSEHAELAQELAGAMFFAHPALRMPPSQANAAGAAASPLGKLGIPGDSLLVVAPLRHSDLPRAHTVLRMCRYQADLGLPLSLVLLCEEEQCRDGSCPFRAETAQGPLRLVASSATELGDDAVAALRAQAHWLVAAELPELADANAVAAPPRARARAPKHDPTPPTREKLQFDNGYGGFSSDGHEYVVRVGPASLCAPGEGPVPPMPWCNIVSNQRFGFLATETGAGYTWAGNSRQNKLTPWSNDPVLDPFGEALYLRDNANGRYWSPQPGPVPSGAWCEVRHGLGWSRWLQRSEAIEQEVVVFVAGEDPVKIVRVRLANRGTRERDLSLYWYARLVLGVQPIESSRLVATSFDEARNVFLANNPLSEDHRGAVAFAAVLQAPGGSAPASFTMDRASFLGRGETMQAPRAVADGGTLDGATGGDPCFALQVPLTLPPRGEVEVVLAFGQGTDSDAALALVEKLRRTPAVEEALEATRASWRDLAGAVQIQTPSRSFDLLMNGWLLYQVLSCRMDARSAYYQAGGAYGFRDQLQDSAALLYARPDLTRAQILLHAAHQFVEGDVLHWWHPPAARGTRTRFSDDLLWLPFLVTTYIGTTGDESVLDEKAPFVKARLLEPGEDETYLLADRSSETASIYEHCCRALDRSLTHGAHGLPLMGTGDWNDGMNRVGRRGQGESVWMAFFLVSILDRFVPMVEKRADWERLRRYRQYRQSLDAPIATTAWDGAWYNRAYYDDGQVLGSHTNEECSIDAIAQSWAVLSGAAPPDRAAQAMQSLRDKLVDEKAGIIRLLWPPFDHCSHDPGYIKGYVPGIRENGGQYTHAAVWAVRALAKLGDRELAMKYFEMVSPVTHARDREATDVYKTEPYVIAADIYGVDPHLGRGGWTWYTGSAAWMYRTGIESLLGLTIEEGRLLRIRPCIPDSWPGFRIKYRLPDRRTTYDIEVDNPSRRSASVVSAMMGSVAVPVDKAGARIVLRRDGKLHKIKVILG